MNLLKRQVKAVYGKIVLMNNIKTKVGTAS